MAMNSMTSIAEPKDNYIQFRATATMIFHLYVMMGMKCLVQLLSEDSRETEYRDQLPESLKKAAARISVVSMISGIVES